jgi:NADPH2:quinone reductase
MASTMRAVKVQKFGPPDVLKVEEVPVPKEGQKEVLVRIYAAGVNPVETYIRSGTYPKLPQLPYTPGADAAGVIEAVGAGVTKFKVGDRVFCTRKVQGSYAEYCVCADDSCWILPQRLTYAQGAGIGIPYFTAYRALFQRAKARPSDTILVHGASGAVGLAAVQLAKARGLTVYGTAGTEVGLKLVKENGARQVFNHKDKDYTNELMKATGGQGFDVILEMLANINLGKDCEMVKMNGTIVVIGSRGNVEISPRLLMGKDAAIMGMNLSIVSDPRDWEDMGAELTAGFENGTLTPIVDKQYPLEKAADAHRDIIESAGAKGNLILNTEQHL